MLTPPPDLPAADLAALLSPAWGLTPAPLDYRPVGFGSHHWATGDGRWFVTADELDRAAVPPAEAFDQLTAALSSAVDLRAAGLEFVAAPISTLDGAPVTRHGRFAVAVYPFLDGESFAWDKFSGDAHRRGTLDMLTAVHTAPAAARRHARRDDFAIPHRAVLQAPPVPPDLGPFARPAAELLAAHAGPIRRALARYDALAAEADMTRAVLTHGEPHPGNTMRTAAGWVLIDWDTALVAPPERDLWSLDPSLHAGYTEATGVTPDPAMLELYRIRWDITDAAVDAARFRRPHAGTEDDAESWEILRTVLANLA